MPDVEKSNEKKYYLTYQPFHSKELHEELFSESELLNQEYGALRFGRKFQSDEFSISDGASAYDDLIYRLSQIVSESSDVSDAKLYFESEVKDFFDSIPSSCRGFSFEELTAVQWLDRAGNSHLVIDASDRPLYILRTIFDITKDNDMLEICEVSVKEAEKIQKRIDKMNEDKKSGIIRY